MDEFVIDDRARRRFARRHRAGRIGLYAAAVMAALAAAITILRAVRRMEVS